MPTVVEIDGYAVRVYTRNQHLPAHVHVAKDGFSIKVMLGESTVHFHSYLGAAPGGREIARALEIVADFLPECWAAWAMYHR